MKRYDLTVLVKAEVSDEEKEAVSNKMEKMVKAAGGSVARFVEMGRKQLAYPVSKMTSALYLSWILELPAEAVVELKRKLTVDKEILRYLLVIVDKESKTK